MFMKSQIFNGTACRTPEYLRILHNLRSSSSQTEESSSPANATCSKESANSLNQLRCSARQFESDLTPNKKRNVTCKQHRSEERKRTRKPLTTFARPSSVTDMDEDSALDDSLDTLSSQLAIAESSSISVRREGLKSILHKSGKPKKKVTLKLCSESAKFSKSGASEETQRSRESKHDILLPESETEVNSEFGINDQEIDESLNDTATECTSKSPLSTFATTATAETSSLVPHLLSSSQTEVSESTEQASNVSAYISKRYLSDEDLLQMRMRRLERNYRRYETCFELGFKAEKILSATHDGANMYFLIKYQGYDEPELVPSHIARSHIPLMVFDYFDQKFCWSQRQAMRGKQILR